MSGPSRQPQLPRLSTAELARRRSQLVVVDAHGSPYFANGHIRGAVNIPPHAVATLAGERVGDTRTAVVVYGASGSANARLVADQLLAAGYLDVSVYEDGLEGWIAAGLPTDATDELHEPGDDGDATPAQQLRKDGGSPWAT